ncbi:hypothetical protein ASG87_12090 [Frateuria sp. Soil773]|uniref:hypothetical protein n=1 Tax=Frateuria sp. Soil773 TaxID=1736407 RepID=UPI0006FC8E5F|nr:hypothetical protein [Frateuria sp. Soil773]KRF02197.1 hypothetical protein ASG87_12090 [Frateuria sp. Soil773]
MNPGIDFAPVYPHHDLLMEIGRVELAIDHLAERSERERASLQPRLESRMSRLLDALGRLPA